MLNCKELAQQYASDYIDNENLSMKEQLAVRFHLLICSHCRRFVKKMRLTKSVINEHEHISGPDDELVQSMAQELMKSRKSNLPSDDDAK